MVPCLHSAKQKQYNKYIAFTCAGTKLYVESSSLIGTIRLESSNEHANAGFLLLLSCVFHGGECHQIFHEGPNLRFAGMIFLTDSTTLL
jgi:hypothetical protein